MKGVRARRGHRRRGWQWSPFVVVLLGPLLAWVLVDHRHGWTTNVSAVVFGTATISAALATQLGSQLRQRLAEKDRPVVPDGLSRKRLEKWRVWLRSKIIKERGEEGGQLDQMVRDREARDLNVSLVDGDSCLPRLRVGGRLLAWSEIKREWDESRGRMVILGDPGYGKTVAALTLVAHINGDKSGAVVAELFSLADWHLWQAEHPSARLGDWLAGQLTLTYDLLPEVSQRLVAEELVLPILDGLDEIPTVHQRRACVDAINAYTRRAAPYRPFVLTCRAEEYNQLAPDWVGAEQHILLAGLQPDQVNAVLEKRTAGRTGWDTIRLRHAAGDAALRELFRSPLYLDVTLHVYRDRDPSELLDLDVGEAIGQLWERLLSLSETADAFPGATVTEVRRWLEFIATGMRRAARQRFMLHELYLMDPHRATTERRFDAIVGLVLGLNVGLGAGLFGGLLYGLIAWLVAWLVFGLNTGPVIGLVVGLVIWLVVGLVVGPIFGLLSWRPRELVPDLPHAGSPLTQKHVGWGERVLHGISRTTLVAVLNAVLIAGLVVGLVVGLNTGLVAGLFYGLVAGLFYGLGVFVIFIVGEGTEAVETEPPARFAHKRPDAVLIASRNSGLLNWLVVGLVAGLFFGLVFALVARQFFGLNTGLVAGLFFGLVYGLAIGLTAGLTLGLGAWLYHYLLRWLLYTRGLLPRRLPQFLDWCAEPSRGWLRITNAYEFRHRSLLDHLALAQSSPTNDEVQHG
jgi:hypothetical protein